jgi:hypothetical protein
MRVELTRYQDMLPALTVDVNGESKQFLFDTGAGITCISPGVAEALSMTPWGRLTGHRMSGERVDLRHASDVRVQVGGVELAPLTVGVLDLVALLPDGWPPIDGILALDAFASQPVTIDLSGRVLELEDAAGLAARADAGSELDVRVARPVQGYARELHVAAKLDGRTYWLELDSGNVAPVLLAEHTGLESDGEITLDLGGTPWTGEFLLQDMILDGNLGQTFLAGRCVTLDLAAERAWVADA